MPLSWAKGKSFFPCSILHLLTTLMAYLSQAFSCSVCGILILNSINLSSIEASSGGNIIRFSGSSFTEIAPNLRQLGNFLSQSQVGPPKEGLINVAVDSVE